MNANFSMSIPILVCGASEYITVNRYGRMALGGGFENNRPILHGLISRLCTRSDAIWRPGILIKSLKFMGAADSSRRPAVVFDRGTFAPTRLDSAKQSVKSRFSAGNQSCRHLPFFKRVFPSALALRVPSLATQGHLYPVNVPHSEKQALTLCRLGDWAVFLSLLSSKTNETQSLPQIFTSLLINFISTTLGSNQNCSTGLEPSGPVLIESIL